LSRPLAVFVAALFAAAMQMVYPIKDEKALGRLLRHPPESVPEEARALPRTCKDGM